VTVPATAPPAEESVKIVALSVAGFIASLKVALSTCVTGTPVAPLVGMVDTTTGGMAVVKLQTVLAGSSSPSVSVAPVVMVAVYTVS
jgi:hypothetical protein